MSKYDLRNFLSTVLEMKSKLYDPITYYNSLPIVDGIKVKTYINFNVIYACFYPKDIFQKMWAAFIYID